MCVFVGVSRETLKTMKAGCRDARSQHSECTKPSLFKLDCAEPTHPFTNLTLTLPSPSASFCLPS